MKNILAAILCSLALSSSASAAVSRVEFTKGEAYRAAKACAEGKCSKNSQAMPAGDVVAAPSSNGNPRMTFSAVKGKTGFKTVAVPYMKAGAAMEKRSNRGLLARTWSFLIK